MDNKLIELALKYDAGSGSNKHVLLVLCLLTNGHAKQVSLDELETGTGLNRKTIMRSLAALEAMSAITVKRESGRASIYCQALTNPKSGDIIGTGYGNTGTSYELQGVRYGMGGEVH